MSLLEDKLRVDVRTLLTQAGFSPGQASQIIEGLNVVEELSKELGEIPDDVVIGLNTISSPFMGMVAIQLDTSDPATEAYFSLVKDLLSEVIRAAYQMGINKAESIWQDRADDEDLYN